MKFNILKSESYEKGIVISIFFNIMAKFLVFLNTVLIAFYFGSNVTTDVYYYLYNTIILLSGFIIALNSSVLIPEAMRLRIQEGENKSIQFLNLFIYLYLLLGIFIGCLFIIEPIKLFSLISKFDEYILAENNQLIFYSTPLFLFIIVTRLLADILTSYKFFTAPMIVEAIINTFIIISLIAFHKQLSLLSILIAMNIGYAINLFILIRLMQKRLNWQFMQISVKSISKRIIKNSVYSQFGNISGFLISFVPIYLLSGFSSGIITALNYGKTIAFVPNQFISSQFSSVSAIRFNELFALKMFKELNIAFIKASQFLLFILLPISAFLFIYASEIVTIVFKRGQFDELSVQSTTMFLKIFSLTLPLLGVLTIVSRLLMATQKLKQSSLYQIANNILLLILLPIFINTWGYIGYPLSVLVSNVINFIVCLFLLNFLFKYVKYREILIYSGTITMTNIALIIMINYIDIILNIDNTILRLTLLTIIFGIIYVVIGFILKLNPDFNRMLENQKEIIIKKLRRYLQ